MKVILFLTLWLFSMLLYGHLQYRAGEASVLYGAFVQDNKELI
jgi:hypothetical protein